MFLNLNLTTWSNSKSKHHPYRLVLQALVTRGASLHPALFLLWFNLHCETDQIWNHQTTWAFSIAPGSNLYVANWSLFSRLVSLISVFLKSTQMFIAFRSLCSVSKYSHEFFFVFLRLYVYVICYQSYSIVFLQPYFFLKDDSSPLSLNCYYNSSSSLFSCFHRLMLANNLVTHCPI